jgi:hypothetical protein
VALQRQGVRQLPRLGRELLRREHRRRCDQKKCVTGGPSNAISDALRRQAAVDASTLVAHELRGNRAASSMGTRATARAGARPRPAPSRLQGVRAARSLHRQGERVAAGAPVDTSKGIVGKARPFLARRPQNPSRRQKRDRRSSGASPGSSSECAGGIAAVSASIAAVRPGKPRVRGPCPITAGPAIASAWCVAIAPGRRGTSRSARVRTADRRC